MSAFASPDPTDSNNTDLSSAVEELQRLINQGENFPSEKRFSAISGPGGQSRCAAGINLPGVRPQAGNGSSTDGQSLCDRFPDMAEDIRMLMEVDSAVHWSRGPVRPILNRLNRRTIHRLCRHSVAMN